GKTPEDRYCQDAAPFKVGAYRRFTVCYRYSDGALLLQDESQPEGSQVGRKGQAGSLQRTCCTCAVRGSCRLRLLPERGPQDAPAAGRTSSGASRQQG